MIVYEKLYGLPDDPQRLPNPPPVRRGDPKQDMRTVYKLLKAAMSSDK